MIEIKRNTITVDLFSYLETSVGWGIPSREQISKHLKILYVLLKPMMIKK